MEHFDVLIVGAGAAGLTAAYDLSGTPYTYKILEASEGLGGRLQKNNTFADFPIDIGGEWLHQPPSILDVIYSHPSVNMSDWIETFPWQTFYEEYEEGSWTEYPSREQLYKFANFTWFDFFNDWIAPEDKNSTIVYGCQVNEIDYTNARVQVFCEDGRNWTASHVIVTASMRVLQDEDILFTPDLPMLYRTAIEEYIMMPGMKVFLKFAETFYKRSFEFADDYSDDHEYGERGCYDEAYGQTTSDHVLACLNVGQPALRYVNMTDKEIITATLAQLDDAYDNQATANFEGYLIQDWGEEPFVRGSYTHLADDDAYLLNVVGQMRKPIDGKIFFAGEAIPSESQGYDYGFAHGAALSGRAAVEKVVLWLEAEEDADALTRSQQSPDPTPAKGESAAAANTANEPFVVASSSTPIEPSDPVNWSSGARASPANYWIIFSIGFYLLVTQQ